MRTPTPDEVIAAVAEAHCLTADDILGRSKDEMVVFARQAAILLTRELLDIGPAALGRHFQRDCANMIYHLRRRDRLFRLRWWREDYDEAKLILREMLDAKVA